jgi:hypothetical protein
MLGGKKKAVAGADAESGTALLGWMGIADIPPVLPLPADEALPVVGVAIVLDVVVGWAICKTGRFFGPCIASLRSS